MEPDVDHGQPAKVVLALKVRDEADIIADNLRFHHALGVAHFVITENGSIDGTLEILRAYERAGLATVIVEDPNRYEHDARGWMERMARIATDDLEADWVLHGDADELFMPARGTISEALAEIPEHYGAVIAPRTEFVGRLDAQGSFAERLDVREARSSLRPKIAHRGDRSVLMADRGPHSIFSSADEAGGRFAGKGPARMRTGGEQAAADVRFVWAPRWPLRILHFPVRSEAQLRRRAEIVIGGAGTFARGPTTALREHYEAGELDRVQAELFLSEDEIEAGIAAGTLVRDARLRRLLPRCPDPLAPDRPPPGTIRVEPSDAELERELADLERDAMRVTSRFQQLAAVRLQRLRHELKRQRRERRALERGQARPARRARHQRRRARRLRAELRAERRRPWSRLRARVQRLRRRG